MTPKVLLTKENMDKLDVINIKHVYAKKKKNTKKSEKIIHRIGGCIFKSNIW